MHGCTYRIGTSEEVVVVAAPRCCADNYFGGQGVQWRQGSPLLSMNWWRRFSRTQNRLLPPQESIHSLHTATMVYRLWSLRWAVLGRAVGLTVKAHQSYVPALVPNQHWAIICIETTFWAGHSTRIEKWIEAGNNLGQEEPQRGPVCNCIAI